MITLTDRYVSAVLVGLPESQRADVERELRGSIADAIDARIDSGESETAAERAALTELGEPGRLSASYSDRPLYLVGPANYLAWRRLLVHLLATIVPVAAVAVFAVQSVALGGEPAWLSRAFAAAITTALTAALHVAFWTTLVFALLERYSDSRTSSLSTWSLDKLPATERKAPRTEVIGLLVFTVLFMGAFVWQQFAPWASSGGRSEPFLNPELWSGWIPFLLAVLAANIPLGLLMYRRGGWEAGTVAVKVLLDVAFAVPVVSLAASGELLNPDFFDSFGWPDLALLDPSAGLLGVGGFFAGFAVVIVVWDTIDLTIKALRFARAGGHRQPLVAR
jgi:hypothetical protein